MCDFFFQAEDGIRGQPRSRGLGDVYRRQAFGPGGERCDQLPEQAAVPCAIGQVVVEHRWKQRENDGESDKVDKQRQENDSERSLTLGGIGGECGLS